MRRGEGWCVLWLTVICVLIALPVIAGNVEHSPAQDSINFPRDLGSYGDDQADDLYDQADEDVGLAVSLPKQVDPVAEYSNKNFEHKG